MAGALAGVHAIIDFFPKRGRVFKGVSHTTATLGKKAVLFGSKYTFFELPDLLIFFSPATKEYFRLEVTSR